VEPVRALYGVVAAENATGGYFVTAGTFTRPARAFAKPNLKLIDGSELWSLVQGLNTAHTQSAATGARADARITQPEETDATVNSPTCPRCGSLMIVKTARRGANAGSKFYACPKFPTCRGTRELEFENT